MKSAASSQRAAATVSGAVIAARSRAAWPAVIALATPPGTRPQHSVQPAHDLVAGPAQVPVPLGPHFQHRRVVIGRGRRGGGRAQRGDGYRPGVVGVVLVRRPGGQQPHPGTQLGLHIEHALPGGEQLPGQQVPHAAGTLDRPGSLRPGRRPLQQLRCLGRAGTYAHLAQDGFSRVDHHGGMGALMRIDTDHHCRHRLPLFLSSSDGGFSVAGMPNSGSISGRTSFEPHHGRARQAGTSI